MDYRKIYYSLFTFTFVSNSILKTNIFNQSIEATIHRTQYNIQNNNHVYQDIDLNDVGCRCRCICMHFTEHHRSNSKTPL